MNHDNLNALQVATLLVAASYGIGFLFGSGEMAVTQGMAGAMYGIATAAGMLVLSLFARRLWQVGVPIWDLLGQRLIEKIVEVWLASPFEGGRHARRIRKVIAMENGQDPSTVVE